MPPSTAGHASQARSTTPVRPTLTIARPSPFRVRLLFAPARGLVSIPGAWGEVHTSTSDAVSTAAQPPSRPAARSASARCKPSAPRRRTSVCPAAAAAAAAAARYCTVHTTSEKKRRGLAWAHLHAPPRLHHQPTLALPTPSC
ncbi:hypothetical protein PMIN01_05002 [Paraphaeosphaeria minitans]|uniref:Uncharacterized protein n=1 Tax=Paraphaeosphaeria minitans TaxID=565426 RepID=A0A9P6GKV0_9PLEO|nr:hypothetical protein PMIN01_05002 [Paraphaeosphaeria minitans]